MKSIHTILPWELERIERFLTNEMEEEEAMGFAKELKTDTSLREKTEEVRLLLMGINEQSLRDRLNDFHKEIGVRVISKKSMPIRSIRRKLLIAASVLTIISLALWWFLQSENRNKKIYSKYYKPDPGLATVMGTASGYDFEKAMVEYKNGEYDKALETWNAMLKEKPGNDTLIYFIGAAYQAKKQYDPAIKNLEKITLDTASTFNRDACWYLGLSYLQKDNIKQALIYIDRSLYPQREDVIKAINKK